MTSLKHKATGHQISTDDKSVEFWEAAGYVAEAKPKPAKKSATGKKK